MALTDSIMLEESDYEEDFFDEDSDFDFDDENVVPIVKKKAGASSKTTKKASSAKTVKRKSAKDKNVASVLAESTNAGNMPKGGKSDKTIEQIYQKKSQLEHILLRPDTYIGSVERVTQPMFVFDAASERIIQRECTFTPGLYKIFDEIVVNAADNKQRDPTMDKMEIVVDAEANVISVKNNGKGIPVAMHKEHDCYVPTLIFGHLLTGSNFDDNEKKTTGGRNGYGAKLANIFSTEFIVECLDAEKGLKFTQVFRNNMTEAEQPVVEDCMASERKKGDYTKITFSPDLQRFKMNTLDSDAVALLSKRAYDIAGSMASRDGKRLVVSLNDKKISVKSFQDYLKLYDGINPPDAYEKVDDRWEVGISVSEGSFQQVSFVNAICTSKGGGHVNHVAEKVGSHLAKTIKKRNKGGTDVKPNQIKNHLCVFVNCLVENPTFDSQTKDNLTTQKRTFESECTLSNKFLKQVDKSGVVDAVLSYAKFKQGQALKRQGGVKKSKLTGIAKLDDANRAGTAKSRDCTLIITEGDSAKSLAMSGLSVVGRDYYGVFPLKGKPLNVREANHKQIMSNEEIKNLVDIMGLKYHTKYDENNIKTLRYGHLMIMADQDHDGSHIKGLVINFIHHFWPSLLDIPGFLQQFITPIVKATKAKKTHTFFTLPEYEEWKESTGNNAKGYSIKYYKGLGTSTSAEAKEYFSNLDTHEVHFRELSGDRQDVSEVRDDDSADMDFESDDALPDKTISGADLIDMVFSKGRVEERKLWLNNLKKDTYLDYSKAQATGISYSEFVNKELVLFSQVDNQRSIPHVMDGFKPSQRKVLYACFKRKLKGEIKVAQLAGYVGEHSAYHHGETSLTGAIIGMAQSYCGSNNINLLTPSGQFGTRRMGGKDHASARYVFTKLEKITRTIFHPDDDALLNYLDDDGMSIEPEYYMPVIPMALVNGSDGIGTGWSTSVPNFDPRDVVSNLRRIIAGEEPKKMKPHYHGFCGEVIPETGKKEGSFIVRGKIERQNDTTLHISELPIQKWTQAYKQFLEVMLNGDGKKIEPEIKDFQENHTDTTVSFTIQATKEKIDSFEREKNGLHGKFKLIGTISTSNMHLFDTAGRIAKYKTPEEILCTFYETRLKFYFKRKELLLEKMRREQLMLSNKARFVEEVCSGDLVVSNRKRSDILADLQDRGYDLMEKEIKNKSDDEDDSEDDDVPGIASDAELAKGYEYVLGMKIWSLTFEKAEQLRAQLAEKTNAVAELEAMAPSQIWLDDLDAIEEALAEREEAMEAAEKQELKAQNKNKKRRAKASKKQTAAKRSKKKADEWDSELEESSDEDVRVESDTDDDFVPSEKPSIRKRNAPAKKPTVVTKKEWTAVAKKAPVLAKKPKDQKASILVTAAVLPESGDDEEAETSDEDEVGESLLERMKKKLMVSPPAKKRAVRLKTEDDARGTKRLSPRELSPDDSEESDDLASFNTAKFEPASVTPARNKAIAKKPAAKRARGIAKGTSKKQPAGRTGRDEQQAITNVDTDSEVEDFDFDFDQDSEPEPASVSLPARGRSGRARSTVNYALMEGSDSDSDFE